MKKQYIAFTGTYDNCYEPSYTPMGVFDTLEEAQERQRKRVKREPFTWDATFVVRVVDQTGDVKEIVASGEELVGADWYRLLKQGNDPLAERARKFKLDVREWMPRQWKKDNTLTKQWIELLKKSLR